jgi:hypothetical protein
VTHCHRNQQEVIYRKELGVVLIVVEGLWVWLDKSLFGPFSPGVHVGVFVILALITIVAVSLLRAIGRSVTGGKGKQKNGTGRASAYSGRR